MCFASRFVLCVFSTRAIKATEGSETLRLFLPCGPCEPCEPCGQSDRRERNIVTRTLNFRPEPSPTHTLTVSGVHRTARKTDLPLPTKSYCIPRYANREATKRESQSPKRGITEAHNREDRCCATKPCMWHLEPFHVFCHLT